MNKTISTCEIHAKGLRKDEHPTGFKKIYIEINIISHDVTDNDMLKVIKLSEDTYCPVWSMIKGNVEIDINFKIDK
jgi:putative redox protein